MTKEVVWVTKYALTSGIEAVEADVSEDRDMVSYGNVGYGSQYAHGKDWHRTPEAALARAEEMRVAKIKSLNKSIDRIKKLVFLAVGEAK
jgi:hypothetical protein